MAFTLEELEAKLKANPYAREFFDLAAAYQKLGRLDEAKKICERGLEKFPGNFQARLLLTQILIAEGRFKEAKLNVDKVLMVVPDNITANYLAGDVCYSLGDKTAALKFYKVVELFEPGKRDVLEKIIAIEKASAPVEETLPKQPAEDKPLPAAETEPEPIQELPNEALQEHLDQHPHELPSEPEEPQDLQELKGESLLAGSFETEEEGIPRDDTNMAVPAQEQYAQVDPDTGEIGEDTLDSLLSDAAPQEKELIEPKPSTQDGSENMEAEPEPAEDIVVAAEAGEDVQEEEERPVEEEERPVEEEERPVKEESAGLSTLTIAELYERQGYPEKAVEVYQHILLKEPERKDIRLKIEKLKDMMLGLEPEGDVMGRDIKSALRRKRIEVLGTWLRKIKEEGNV